MSSKQQPTAKQQKQAEFQPQLSNPNTQAQMQGEHVQAHQAHVKEAESNTAKSLGKDMY